MPRESPFTQKPQGAVFEDTKDFIDEYVAFLSFYL